MRHPMEMPVETPYRASLLAILILLVGVSCRSTPDIIETDITEPDNGVLTAKGLTNTQEKLVEGAHEILGREKLFIRGGRFGMDCSGIVLSLYWYAGIDMAKDGDVCCCSRHASCKRSPDHGRQYFLYHGLSPAVSGAGVNSPTLNNLSNYNLVQLQL